MVAVQCNKIKRIITNEKLAEVLFLQKPLADAARDKQTADGRWWQVVCLNLQPNRSTTCLVGHRYWILDCEGLDRTEIRYQMFKSLQSDSLPLERFDIATFRENTLDWITVIFSHVFG